MADTATAPDMAGITVHRTNRDTWHVINRITGDHWEAANQAEVLQSVQTYRDNAAERERLRLEAEERARNPQVGEFGTTIPGDPAAFEFTPVSAAGKANVPTVAEDSSDASDYAAFKEWQAQQAALNATDDDPAPVARDN
jgi:hypothetical protein